MRFWDSSAIIPLVVPEEETEIVTRLLTEDPQMLVWTLTITEIYSAVYRKIRAHQLQSTLLPSLRDRLQQVGRGWSEIIQIEGVRSRANRLLAVHPLRAADALQLAAALLAFQDRSEGAELVTFDFNLRQAAENEGFVVLP